jgi:translation initiation factor IF-1
MKIQKEILKGKVIEPLPDMTFKVELENKKIVLAYLSGKMRINYIKLVPGDEVLIEISRYDPTKGRIIKRL